MERSEISKSSYRAALSITVRSLLYGPECCLECSGSFSMTCIALLSEQLMVLLSQETTALKSKTLKEWARHGECTNHAVR